MNSPHSISNLEEQRKLVAAAYDPQLFREAGNVLIASLHDHLQTVRKGQGSVLNWCSPEETIQLATAEIESGNIAPLHPGRDWQSATTNPESADTGAVLARFRNLVEQALSRGQNLHHPHYVGHQVPASLPLAGLFDAATTVTNQVMAIYEMGPWATSVERAVVNQLGEAMGLAEGTFCGLVTSGGSLANLTALLTARNISLGESWIQGVHADTPPPVLVTHAEAHYCVTRSAGILGLGTNQIVRVPLDDKRRMDVGQLEKTLQDLRDRKIPIVAVCAAACATPIGAFDPLVEIAEVCRNHQVWLHVDAAHGGAACLSTRHRHLVQGLELADSIVCDAHKMMFMPALCAFVFYRNSEHRYATFEQIAPYLFDPSAPGMAEFDNGITNVECTKRAAAMGLWGIWSMFGKQLFAALVDITFDMAQVFFELLQEQSDFEVYCQPTCNIVAFRYLPTELNGRREDEMDAFQLKLRRLVIESGKFYLVQTSIDGRSYLRTTIINPLTSKKHLNSLIECLREQGQQLLQTTNSS
ncbi:MAG: pyridoxal-dependent decarboxylase [Planctomycetaceae bacterium]|nr:pyridoxal-dependent decarboxylase [Planctomycetaceae bacterium]